MFLVLISLYIHTGQAKKICLSALGILCVFFKMSLLFFISLYKDLYFIWIIDHPYSVMNCVSSGFYLHNCPVEIFAYPPRCKYCSLPIS